MDASDLLSGSGIVPVVEIDRPEFAEPLADVLISAGFYKVEITLRTDSALESIEKIATTCPEACVGAGSIRTADQLRQAKNAGAQFAVSPGSSDLLLEAAILQRMPFVPGAVTASECIRLREAGYTLMKFFPAELSGGLKMLKALGAPLPEARFFPTGGITPALATDYLAQPNVMCVGGSWLTPRELLAVGDFASIARIAGDAARLVE